VKSQVVLVGLPSAGLESLASQLDVRYREVPEIREIWHGLPDEDETVSEDWISSSLAECLADTGRGAIVLVYISPAALLMHRLERAAESKLAPEDLETCVKLSLEFWRVYHTAMLDQYRQHEDRALLLNADHAVDIEALLARMKERFSPRSIPGRTAHESTSAESVEMPRASLFQIIDTLAPECLELYVELESCAELMGREPEFDLTGPEGRHVHMQDLLRLLVQQARTEQLLAGNGVDSVDPAEGLKTLQNRLNESMAAAGAKEREVASLQDQVSGLQRERDETGQQYQELIKQITGLEKETNSLRQEKESLILLGKKLQQERDDARQKQQQLGNQIGGHEKEKKSLQQEKDSLLLQIKTLKQERDDARQKQQQLSNKTSENEKEKKALQEENELLLHQLHQVQEELEHYYLLHQKSVQGQGVESQQPTSSLASTGEAPGNNGRDVPGTSLTEGASRMKAAGSWFGIAGKRNRTLHQNSELVRQSGYFDEAWYLEQYPDVAQAGVDPIEHYLRAGFSEGRNPGPRFDTRWYLEAYPDVAQAGMNPLLHYIKFGRDEGRYPGPLRT